MSYHIYKIKSLQTDKIYIGSTKKTLKNRLSGHKSDYKKWVKDNTKNYLTSFEILKFNDYQIELIESCVYVDNAEKLKKEGYHIALNIVICVNKVIAGRTKKQHYELNKEKILEARNQYYELNKDQIIEKNKQYRQDNKEQIAEASKQYYELNKDRISEVKKQHYESNKDRTLEQNKQYYELNKDRISEVKKQYYESNKDRIRLRRRELRKIKKENTIKL